MWTRPRWSRPSARCSAARGTDITFTLPVDLGGIPAERLDLVQKAAAANVPVTVNIMAMNFKTGGNWGQAMVDSAQATLDQLRKIYPNASEAVQNRTLSITVMIGRNDVGVITQPDDAQKVIDFAKSRGVGRLGFWALARDNGALRQEGQGPAGLQRDRAEGLAVHPAVRELHRPDVRVGRGPTAAGPSGGGPAAVVVHVAQGCRSVAARNEPSAPMSMWNGVDSW